MSQSEGGEQEGMRSLTSIVLHRFQPAFTEPGSQQHTKENGASSKEASQYSLTRHPREEELNEGRLIVDNPV